MRKNTKKRIFAVLMVLALVGSLVPTMVSAAASKHPHLIVKTATKPSVGGHLQVITGSNGEKMLGDENGKPIQLRGMSTHGLQWFPGIINDNAFAALARDWDANLIRLALYVSEDGYATHPELKQKVIDGIDYAIKYNMYVIVDWHVTSPGDPNASVYSGAKAFFKSIADKYPNDPHILYELANEPNGNAPGVTNDAAGWTKVKDYAKPIIKQLRDDGNHNIVIVGSPSWSQRPDLAALDPIDDANTMYSVHFYTGTHLPAEGDTDRTNVMNNVTYALKHGAPIFATEWGTSEASGNNGPFLDNADNWLDYLNEHNISWANWSLTNKAETSAAFIPLELGKTAATDLDPGADQVWAPRELSISGEYARTRIKGISYAPIDRTKEEFTTNVWNFNDGTTQGFRMNNDSPTHPLTVSNVNNALQIAGLKADSTSVWDNRISADGTAANPDILGADKITMDVIASVPTPVSIAAVPQAATHDWASPSTAAQVTASDYVQVKDHVYKAFITLSGDSVPNLANIANDPDHHTLTNIILLVASPNASVISLDNITFSGVRTIVAQPIVHAPIGTAAVPSDFQDSTRQGWNWAGDSGFKGALTVEEANGSKAISWNINYPDVKPSDNWASAPRLMLEKSDLTRGNNKYLDFDFYLNPVRATRGALAINLVFGAPSLGYWAQHPASISIPLSALSQQEHTVDGLYHYKASFDLEMMDKVASNTPLGKILIIVADSNSDFSGRMYVDNVTFTNHDGGNTPAATPDVIDLPQADASGKIAVAIANDQKIVYLPANAAAIYKQSRLELKNDHVTLEIPGHVLMKLQGLIPASQLPDAAISLQMEPVASTNSSALLDKTKVKYNVDAAAAGDVLEFSLSIIGKDGKKTKLSQFDEPITVGMKINGNAKKDLLGVYYIADDGTLEYMGGELTDGIMVAQITHFGQYAVLSYDKSFTDVSDSFWAAQVIKQMAAKHILQGVNAAEFAPAKEITRAEFAALIVRALDIKAKGEAKFSDVSAAEWYASAVAAASEAGIVAGRSDSAFDPNAAVTREEMAITLVRAYELSIGSKASAGNAASFADQASISSWAQDAVNAAQSLGFIKGRDHNQFVPQGNATRAESAQVISTLISKLKIM